jgi:hypothetical protein
MLRAGPMSSTKPMGLRLRSIRPWRKLRMRGQRVEAGGKGGGLGCARRSESWWIRFFGMANEGEPPSESDKAAQDQLEKRMREIEENRDDEDKAGASAHRRVRGPLPAREAATEGEVGTREGRRGDA